MVLYISHVNYDKIVALRGSLPAILKVQFEESVDDIREYVRRRCRQVKPKSLTKKNLVKVQFRNQLKDIIDELFKVRECHTL